jgi:hypothetical protein
MLKGDAQNALLEREFSLLPQRPSLLPKNSLGALLLDFRSSLKSLGIGEQDWTSATETDFEKVLTQLSSADAQALNKELEDIAPNVFAYFSRNDIAHKGEIDLRISFVLLPEKIVKFVAGTSGAVNEIDLKSPAKESADGR